jgi:hypothetical protein
MVRQSAIATREIERIPYLGKHIGTYQESEGLPLAGLTVLLEGKADAAKKEVKKASKLTFSDGLDDVSSYIKVGSSDVAVRT